MALPVQITDAVVAEVAFVRDALPDSTVQLTKLYPVVGVAVKAVLAAWSTVIIPAAGAEVPFPSLVMVRL